MRQIDFYCIFCYSDSLFLTFLCLIFCVKQDYEESCWLFEYHDGRKHGPHSLVELYSWYHYGYILDSVTVSLISSLAFCKSLTQHYSTWCSCFSYYPTHSAGRCFFLLDVPLDFLSYMRNCIYVNGAPVLMGGATDHLTFSKFNMTGFQRKYKSWENSFN